jgi:hypothetical protein
MYVTVFQHVIRAGKINRVLAGEELTHVKIAYHNVNLAKPFKVNSSVLAEVTLFKLYL